MFCLITENNILCNRQEIAPFQDCNYSKGVVCWFPQNLKCIYCWLHQELFMLPCTTRKIYIQFITFWFFTQPDATVTQESTNATESNSTQCNLCNSMHLTQHTQPNHFDSNQQCSFTQPKTAEIPSFTNTHNLRRICSTRTRVPVYCSAVSFLFLPQNTWNGCRKQPAGNLCSGNLIVWGLI